MSSRLASLGTDLLGWGDNSGGQILGKRDIRRIERPTVISQLADIKIIDIACKGNESIAIDSSGKIFEWGEFRDHSLIQYTHTIKGISKIGVTGNLRVGLANDTLYAWGSLQIGKKKFFSESQPKIISDEGSVEKISIGEDHILGFGSNKVVSNPSYHLANGIWQQRIQPMRISRERDFYQQNEAMPAIHWRRCSIVLGT